MLDFYIKYKNKNVYFENLLNEIENIFRINEIPLLESNEVYFTPLTQYTNIATLKRANNIFFTLEKEKEKLPFLKKYIKPQNVTMTKFRFADLFAGCGGLSLGMEQAGFNCTFVNEIDATFAETHYFNHNIPLSNYYIGDINNLLQKLSHINLGELDLVCGGPPCQGFSMANRQRVIDDPRNELYKSYLKFLQYTKPKFFVMENVKGMANKVDEIIQDFNNYLGTEYNIAHTLLNAKDFGIPQNRARFFLIGNKIGIDSTTIINNIKAEKIEKYFVLQDAINDLPALKAKTTKNANNMENDDFGFFIRKNINTETQYTNFINNNKAANFIFNHKNRYNNDRDIEIYTRLPQGGNSLHPSIADIMPYTSRNHMFKDKYFKLESNKVSKTITSHMKFDCNMYIHPHQPRGLSPREAARLQTFPDDFLIRGSQNQWYAQVGNAVPVKLAQIIGKHIIKFLC